MLRATLAAAILLGSTALAADPLPKDISPDDRAELIKAWRVAWLKARTHWQQKHDDAVTLTKFAASKKEGEKQLADAKAALKNLEAKPWAITDSPFAIIQAKGATVGSVVGVQGSNPFISGESIDGGTLVETVVGPAASPMIVRYVIASPLPAPKVNGKNPPTVDLTGLWYWAGSVEVKGKKIPLLYRFEIKPDDFPK